MFNRQFGMGVRYNPLVLSPFVEGNGNMNFAPGPTDFIITESGDNIISESGDFMITEN